MEYLYFALIAGSLLTSLHPSEEACLGRKALLEQQHKVFGKCAKAQDSFNAINLTLSGSGICNVTTCQLLSASPAR